MTPRVYGIPNCDSCRAARKWLTQAGIDHEFIDVRAEDVPATTVDDWLEALGWDTLINRRGKTWRELPPATRDSVDAESARDLILAHPLLLKRPVLVKDGEVSVGFSGDRFAALFTAGN